MLFSRNTERESVGRQEQHSIGHNLSEHRAHEERRDGSRRHVCGLPTTPTTYLFMSTSRLFVRRWSKLFIARCPAGTDRSFGLARKTFLRTYVLYDRGTSDEIFLRAERDFYDKNKHFFFL